MRKLVFSVGMAALLLSMLAGCGGSNAASDGDTDTAADCTSTADCLGETYCDPVTKKCVPLEGDGDTETFTDCVGVECPEGMACEPISDAQTEFACRPTDIGDGDKETESEDCPYCCPIIVTTPDEGGTLNFGALTSTSQSTFVVNIKNDSNLPSMILKIYNFYIHDMSSGLPSQTFVIDSLLLPSGNSISWEVAKQALERKEPILELKQNQTVGVNLRCSGVSLDTQLAQLAIISNGCGATAIRKIFLKTDFKGRSKIKLEYENPVSGSWTAVNDTTPVNFGNVDLNSQPKKIKFRVSNGAWTQGDNKPLVITSIGQREGYNSHFSVENGPNIDSRWDIEADASSEFVISFRPQKQAFDYNPLISTIQIANNSDDPLLRLFEFDVSGYAESSALSVVPWPLDCGRTIAKDPSYRCTADGPTDPYNLTCPNGNCCPIYQQCLKKAGASTGTCYMPLDPAAMILNYTGAEYQVTKVFFTAVKADDTPGCEDHFYAPTHEDDFASTDERFNSLEGQLLAPRATIGFPLYFHPAVPTGRTFKERCSLSLTLKNTLDSSNTTLYFDSICTAVKENVKPIANLSPTSHGEEINTKIDNIPLDGTSNQLCFWADISYDPDMKEGAACGGMDYTWAVTDGAGTELPFGTITDTILKECRGRPSGPQVIGRCYTFNRPGDYRLTLVTTDDDGANSDPKVVNIKINGNENMRAVLTFECGGAVLTTNTLNMNLRISSPNSYVCDATRAVGTGLSCSFGNNDGVASFIDVQPDCQTNGNVESALIRDIKDGYWTFSAKYINDCDALFTGLFTPICTSHYDNNPFRLQLFTESGSTRTQIANLTGTISMGQTKSWRILREAGIFKQSTLEPTY